MDNVAKGKRRKTTKRQPKNKVNINIEILALEKERDSTEDNLDTSCCVGCSNRNLIRAVLTNNQKLFTNCVNSKQQISSLFDTWSPEIKHNCFYYAMISNNIRMLHEIFESSHKNLSLARYPSFLIEHVDTGMVSKKAYGVRVRKVQMARGNRQGNNAFLEKNYEELMYNDEDFEQILGNHNLQTKTLTELIAIEPGMADLLNDHIIHATISGNRKIAAFLIDRIKTHTNYGYNNLHFEVLSRDGEDLSEYHKASIHKKSSYDHLTPFHCACINPNSKYLQSFLSTDPDVQLTDLMSRKPIHYAAACEGPEPLKLLMKSGANANDLDYFKRSPLHYAAMYGRAENVKILLDEVPRLQKLKDNANMMPFHYACKNGHLDVVMCFMEKEIKLAVGSGFDRLPPLCFAAAFNHFELCDYFLKGNATLKASDKFKRTPLILAARNGNAKVITLLLQNGALVDAADSSGNTALHYASAYGWIECAEILIKASANVNSSSNWKLTPLNVAMLKSHFGMVRFLLSQPNVDVNCKDEMGRTLVSLAVDLTTEDGLNYIEFLLRDKKADPNIADIDGATPLHYLARK